MEITNKYGKPSHIWKWSQTLSNNVTESKKSQKKIHGCTEVNDHENTTYQHLQNLTIAVSIGFTGNSIKRLRRNTKMFQKILEQKKTSQFIL